MGTFGGIALIVFGVLIIVFGDRKVPDIGRPGVVSRLFSTYGREGGEWPSVDLRKWGIGLLCIVAGIRLVATHGHF